MFKNIKDVVVSIFNNCIKEMKDFWIFYVGVLFFVIVLQYIYLPASSILFMSVFPLGICFFFYKYINVQECIYYTCKGNVKIIVIIYAILILVCECTSLSLLSYLMENSLNALFFQISLISVMAVALFPWFMILKYISNLIYEKKSYRSLHAYSIGIISSMIIIYATLFVVGAVYLDLNDIEYDSLYNIKEMIKQDVSLKIFIQLPLLAIAYIEYIHNLSFLEILKYVSFVKNGEVLLIGYVMVILELLMVVLALPEMFINYYILDKFENYIDKSQESKLKITQK